MAVSGGQLASVSTKVVKRVEKELQQSKIILRHLPPDFTEEKLTEVISPIPDHSLFYFFPGDTSLGRYGCARAYINFTDTSDILPFRDQYDGTILESEKGVRYRLVIEYAPYQTVPKRKKVDQRAGTLEKDADYQSFLESYEAEVTPLSSVDVTELMLSLSKPAGIQSTPLVDYLKDRRSSSRYRGSRNKVILFAPNSKKKKGKSDKSKNSKESGDKYEDRKEFSKKKPAKEAGDTSGKTVVQVLGREKSKKPAAASASYNGDSPQPSTRGKGSSRSVPNEGASPSTDSQSKDSPNSRSRNKDRPDQKFYSRGGRSRGGGSREEGGRGDKRGDVAGRNDGDRKSRPPKGDSDGRTRGRGGRGKSGRYSDYDRGYRDGGYRGDQYRDGGYRGDQYRDGGYRGDQYRGAVDHQYHFQDDGADDTGTGYRGKGGGSSRHSSGRGRGSSYRGGQGEYRSSHK